MSPSRTGVNDEDASDFQMEDRHPCQSRPAGVLPAVGADKVELLPACCFSVLSTDKMPVARGRAGLVIGWKPNFHSSFVISGVAVNYGSG
jgi:hypothetical protein